MSAERVGFVGLGAMGRHLVRSLLRAGYEVAVHDLDARALAACEEHGATPAGSVAGLVRQCETVCFMLPSSETLVHVVEADAVPHARGEQVFIDFGTTTAPETRRLAQAFAERGAFLLDVPVSGGPQGAERGELYLFGGGDARVFERRRPLLTAVGGDAHLTYCGPSGSGQVVKGVNQLMMALGNAAYLEAISFGVRAGIDPHTIERALGDRGRWRSDFALVAQRVVDGSAETVAVKYRELPYFLAEAAAQGMDLPLTRVLHATCAAGPNVVVDDNRSAPSYWHELLYRGAPALAPAEPDGLPAAQRSAKEDHEPVQ
ncbi:2-hydroxy-3-oxopropionate reductase [soil metagenome]